MGLSHPHSFRCPMTEAVIRKLRGASRDISQPPRDQRTARMLLEALTAAYSEVQAENRGDVRDPQPTGGKGAA